jgi:hypothetical protein
MQRGECRSKPCSFLESREAHRPEGESGGVEIAEQHFWWIEMLACPTDRRRLEGTAKPSPGEMRGHYPDPSSARQNHAVRSVEPRSGKEAKLEFQTIIRSHGQTELSTPESNGREELYPHTGQLLQPSGLVNAAWPLYVAIELLQSDEVGAGLEDGRSRPLKVERTIYAYAVVHVVGSDP